MKTGEYTLINLLIYVFLELFLLFLFLDWDWVVQGFYLNVKFKRCKTKFLTKTTL